MATPNAKGNPPAVTPDNAGVVRAKKNRSNLDLVTLHGVPSDDLERVYELEVLEGSVAAWRAVFQLIGQPYRWEKTAHGLARTSRRFPVV